MTKIPIPEDMYPEAISLPQRHSASLVTERESIIRTHRIVRFVFIMILVIPLLEACSPFQQVLQGTATPSPTSTQTSTLTSTPTPTLSPTLTSTPDLAATKQHETFFSLVQEYFDKGYIPSVNGVYYRLNDFSISDAAVGYYEWQSTGKQVTDFILKTHITMSTANNSSPKTGCGIAFRADFGDNSLVIVGQDGRAYFERIFRYPGEVWGTVSNPVELDFLLVVGRKNIRLFINEKQVLEYEDTRDTHSGDIGMAVFAGSYEDYGSRCEFTDTELWIVQR